MASFHLSCTEPAPDACRGGALAIGNFDGVHLGHQALAARLRWHADRVGGPAVAMTFDPHPLQILAPARFQPTLTTLDDRSRLLLQCGIDHVIILRTDPELLGLRSRTFFDQVIIQNLSAKALVEGPNFRFGHNREGTIDSLRQYTGEAGIALEIVEPLTLDGQMVSSSRIRQALERGDLETANRRLGRPYFVTGAVVAGQRRGRNLGFPTANLEGISTLIPAEGVYAGCVQLHERSWPAAVNIGPNPTFDEAARKVEAHLLGYQGDLYGMSMTVQFLERLRETQRFSSVQELVDQLQKDALATTRVFQAHAREASSE